MWKRMRLYLAWKRARMHDGGRGVLSATQVDVETARTLGLMTRHNHGNAPPAFGVWRLSGQMLRLDTNHG